MRKTLVLALLALTALVPGAARVPLAHAAGSCMAGDTTISIVDFSFQQGVEDDCPWYDGLLDEHRRR